MIAEFRQLVQDVAELTGAAPPAMLEEDAPVLEQSALEADGSMYVIGLIGGKDVGKSALVNALVGQEITPRTSHGPGTETVIAYAHQSRVDELEALLGREAPGQFRIVTHTQLRLERQVLLDLPDIDSHYASHVELTRRMLRHMLFPIWMQSVEKYADQRPRELLRRVAMGNNPGNFIFCLNKADQLVAREGDDAAKELSRDYAERLARTLGLDEPPRVWLISAIQGEEYDLPALRQQLAIQRSEEDVNSSRQLASRRQGGTLADWLGRQDLEGRLAALERLGAAAEEELAARLGVPLVESVVPKILADNAYRLALADDLMARRVARWPIVNILHVLLSPLLSLARTRLPLTQQAALEGPAELVSLHLQSLPMTGVPRGKAADAVKGSGESTQPLAERIQTTFAYLQQSFPGVGRLYAEQKPWEAMPAQMAEADLRQRLATTLERQRAVLRARLGSGGAIGGTVRLVLTVGALFWFPIIQPLLATWLGTAEHTWRALSVKMVELLGVNNLLASAGFLAVYYAFLWLALKWATQRRVDRRLGRWASDDKLDPTLSLAGQVMDWTDALLAPIRAATGRLEELVGRFRALREALSSKAEAA